MVFSGRCQRTHKQQCDKSHTLSWRRWMRRFLLGIVQDLFMSCVGVRLHQDCLVMLHTYREATEKRRGTNMLDYFLLNLFTIFHAQWSPIMHNSNLKEIQLKIQHYKPFVSARKVQKFSTLDNCIFLNILFASNQRVLFEFIFKYIDNGPISN